MKVVTIPRLELLSCVLLAKLLISVKNAINQEVKVDRLVCWSDSEVSLFWIKGLRKEWKPWVENRVVQIRERVGVDVWRHVQGEHNPADLATRQNSIDKVMCKRWWHGPEFLFSKEENWPHQKYFDGLKSGEVLYEAKKSTLTPRELLIINEKSDDLILGTTANLAATEMETDIANLIDLEKFSYFKKLCSIISYVLRFTKNLRNSVNTKKEENVIESTITVEEFNSSERLWIKSSQLLLRQDENFNQLKKSLNLYEDNTGLWRSRMRLSEADEFNLDMKCPVLLRNKGHLMKLIILHAHEEVYHSGVECTLNKIRSRYWIIKGRQSVKTVLKSCVLCRVYQGRTLKPRPLANLPSYRICSEYSFQTTGIDYAGPLLVKEIYTADSQMYKCYILLFTCATSRSVHLELIPDMSSQTLIRALKRFFSRKGFPSLFISDNFKTFKSAVLKTFLRENLVEWEFILELSSWWGGFYERLVKLVKDALRKVIKNAKLNYEELQTILIEIESTVSLILDRLRTYQKKILKLLRPFIYYMVEI